MTPGPPSSSLRIGPFSTPPPSPCVRRAELGAVPGGRGRRLGRAAPPPAAPAASAKRPHQARRLLPALPRGRRTPPPSPCRRLASSLPPLAAFSFLRLAPSLPPHLSRSPRRPPAQRKVSLLRRGSPSWVPPRLPPPPARTRSGGGPQPPIASPAPGGSRPRPHPRRTGAPSQPAGDPQPPRPRLARGPGARAVPGCAGREFGNPHRPTPNPGRRRGLGRRWAGLYPPLPGCSDPKALGRPVP